jgi:hypothetical protein
MKHSLKFKRIRRTIRMLFFFLFSFIAINIFSDHVYKLTYIFIYASIFNSHYSEFYRHERHFNLNSINSGVDYKSECECRNDQAVNIKMLRINRQSYYSVSVKNQLKMSYNISKHQFESTILTCNMYNSLRRGPHTKVLSLSLYGKNRFFYDLIRELAVLAKRYYPDWIVRINHDNSIDKRVKCETECLKDEQNEYLDNVDFCDVNALPVGLNGTWNAGSFMHGMTWRWLPIGDGFVDYFASRDTDSWISQREVDSVKVWLKSNTIFHLMRGNFLFGLIKDYILFKIKALKFLPINLFIKKIIPITVCLSLAACGALQILEIEIWHRISSRPSQTNM